MKLWLDDLRDPKVNGAIGFAWAKNYDEAFAILKTGNITFASLDHDIGACQNCIEKLLHIGDTKTAETTFYNWCPHVNSGYDLVSWMEDNNIWPVDGVTVHSMNPIGRLRMKQIIDRHYQNR